MHFSPQTACWEALQELLSMEEAEEYGQAVQLARKFEVVGKKPQIYCCYQIWRKGHYLLYNQKAFDKLGQTTDPTKPTFLNLRWCLVVFMRSQTSRDPSNKVCLIQRWYLEVVSGGNYETTPRHCHLAIRPAMQGNKQQ